MTYNIRLDYHGDGENRWELRKKHLGDLLKFYEADVFGVQEALPNQVAYLDSIMSNYHHIGEGRDGNGQGEASCIFYNKEKLVLISQATFWLSETPERVSKSWDAALNRVCSYGKFSIKSSDKEFYVFNTHFDHIGEKAREESAKLIHQRINEINKENVPVVIMGDFNLEPNSIAIQYLSEKYQNAMEKSEFKYGEGGSFNGFNFHEVATKMIDYIFCTKIKFKILKHAILTDSYQCHYPSDHFPILADIEFED